MTESTKALFKEKWNTDDIVDQINKIFVITGSNSGLGLEATKQLALKGATVILAIRNMEKGEIAVNKIKEIVPNAKLDIMHLDLSSLKSIHEFSDKFHDKYKQLHVLINNAGVMQPPKMKTEDGFELQIGVNHFGHYALTGLLFDIIKATPNSRIISQSSFAANMGKIDFNDLNHDKKYSRTGAYGQSKLANLLFIFELDRKLKENGITSVKSIAVHPGYTNTGLQQNGPSVNGKSFLFRIYSLTDKLFAQHVSMGVLPMLYAATAPDVESGDYIGPAKLMQTRGHPKRVKATKKAYIKEDAAKLWEISEEKTKVKFNFN